MMHMNSDESDKSKYSPEGLNAALVRFLETVSPAKHAKEPASPTAGPRMSKKGGTSFEIADLSHSDLVRANLLCHLQVKLTFYFFF